ncbi:MAG: Lrp/AsnC family transcriptional regulator [Anaerostipes sp.]|jgi:DNA-binding Lrp family transcriptional regulator|nr:Lrp/AsnC family transcriptional regulator [Anaerostipes sp.]
MNLELREAVLLLLEKNSRLDLKELAVMLDSTEAAIANEIADMEKEHIICGYHTLINWDKTSKEKLTATVEVKVTPQRGQGFDLIAERIYNFPEVKALYLMSGSYDFLVMLEGKTMKEVSMFTSSKLAPLDTVIGTVTHFVLKKYKDHGTVLESKKIDERQVVTP